jgi:type III restriction enzyme
MSDFEVENPILSSPFEEPREHWWILEGEKAERRAGRRPPMYFYRDPKAVAAGQGKQPSLAIELKLVSRIRALVKTWREQRYPGVTRTTRELLDYWRRDGRDKRLFFAQLEAAETIIFLREARSDFLQGVDIPRDDPSEAQKAEGYSGFTRQACKLATGSGKTTVMGMVAAWSLLNKVADRADARFSDVVLAVCPNVTIRDRLRELDPELGATSLYRTRDLVPEHVMPALRQGRVVVTNWHVFEPQTASAGGQTGRVIKAGVMKETRQRIHFSDENTSGRGKRYLTRTTFESLVAGGSVEPLAGTEKTDGAGNVISIEVRERRYVESDAAIVARVLGREVGGKQNLLVLNDEAHHAYRIRREEPDETEEDDFCDEDEAEEFYKEATVWVEGLDRVHKLRGINLCVDLSATPYFLGRVGPMANRPFPWVVSDFGLIDAIESGLVKIPQLAVRDTTGAQIPGYFNIWNWVLPQLSPAEKGGKKSSPKPEAILKYSHTPIAMLGGLWEKTRRDWAEQHARGERDARPPVFILVCKNTAIAKVIHEWIADGTCPAGVPPLRLDSLRDTPDAQVTIRVDSKVSQESDEGGAKGDQNRWMRHTLDTVGRQAWPRDSFGREIMPDGFVELAQKLFGKAAPLHPPGRDVRCIVSVGMLTEGWDCNTVTHIVGLRPFMSQLLCEQVVGRALRRASYEPGADGLMAEELAKVFGVPFDVVPFKANPQGATPPPAKRFHVRAVPEKAKYAITFPRVEGYTQAIRNRITVDWEKVPPLVVDPQKIPPEVEMKGLSITPEGRPSLMGPGRRERADLTEFRATHRVQQLAFELSAQLTKNYHAQGRCDVPVQALFPQCQKIVSRYLAERINVVAPADVKDAFLAPYYGWLVENLTENIRGDTSQGESPEVPIFETSRGPGSTADVSFWSVRDVRPAVKCHLNFVVADTEKWEQSAAYYIDTHPAVEAFVKNAGLGFAIPYFHNGQEHDYVPDFIVRMSKPSPLNLIVETKGYDPLQEVKEAAARRWCEAMNADRRQGRWRYALCKGPLEVRTLLDGILLKDA